MKRLLILMISVLFLSYCSDEEPEVSQFDIEQYFPFENYKNSSTAIFKNSVGEEVIFDIEIEEFDRFNEVVLTRRDDKTVVMETKIYNGPFDTPIIVETQLYTQSDGISFLNSTIQINENFSSPGAFIDEKNILGVDFENLYAFIIDTSGEFNPTTTTREYYYNLDLGPVALRTGNSLSTYLVYDRLE